MSTFIHWRRLQFGDSVSCWRTPQEEGKNCWSSYDQSDLTSEAQLPPVVIMSSCVFLQNSQGSLANCCWNCCDHKIGDSWRKWQRNVSLTWLLIYPKYLFISPKVKFLNDRGRVKHWWTLVMNWFPSFAQDHIINLAWFADIDCTFLMDGGFLYWETKWNPTRLTAAPPF